MSSVHRLVRGLLLVLLVVLLAGCGFHLRQSVDLPPGMQKVHLKVGGSAELADRLGRQLMVAGAELRDAPGPGVAELEVQAGFQSRALTVNSYASVREFSVVLAADFRVLDDHGEAIVPAQHLEMQREFTYDRSQALGTATREEQVRQSLVKDMARAILRRLQATGAEDEAA